MFTFYRLFFGLLTFQKCKKFKIKILRELLHYAFFRVEITQHYPYDIIDAPITS